MTLGFVGNADFFMRFFEKCTQEGIDDEKERLNLLMSMAIDEPGRCSVFETERSKEQVAKDFSKNYGKTLYIKSEE